MSITNWDNLPLTLTPADVAKVLGVGENNAYTLFHDKTFPSVRVGRRLLVGRNSFRNWLEKSAG
jgi:excisionase family DNA binding protein